MEKKDDSNSPSNNPKINNKNIIPVSISSEMRSSYLDYAMSVITQRALPDVRDGLKPVHRRILYAMSGLGLSYTSKQKKSASVVGDVLGKYHPHGDSSVYDAMVKMAQDFSYRYPLVIGQGNFGCFTKDTKVRLTDGRNLSFGELIEEHKSGKQNYTFTVDHEGNIAIAPINKPRMTRRDAEVMNVVLDNNESVTCTLNHKFLLKNRVYKEAKDLKPGDSLMPLYTRLSTNKDSNISEMLGYEMVLHPTIGEWVFVHHLSDKYNVEHDVYGLKDGKVRHHVDFNKLNNNPDNIKRMQWLEHWKLHSNMTAERHKTDDEYVKKLAQGRKTFWSKKENHEAYAKRMSERNKRNWQDPVYRENMIKSLSEVNKEYIKKHPEKRQEFSERATQTLKRLWRNPEYRRLMNEKIVRANKKRTTNLTGKVKFDVICKDILKKGEILSEFSYQKTREKLYQYGSSTKWQTGLYKYYGGDSARVMAEVNKNHKVKKVEFLRKHEDVYDITVPMTHNFALSAGVFVHNSVDGDPPAAMRYTEARMSRISGEMLKDLEKDTVLWRPNYDGTRTEPEYLPAGVPNLLLNGTLGIAVGMATNIPPHNMRELIDATTHLVDSPKATTEDLLEYVKGPDFPTGGIAFGKEDIAHAYASGRGGVVVRGESDIVEEKAGAFQIIITSLPYRVNKADLILKIADLVRDKKIEGIKDMRDESTSDIRVVIDLKSGAQPQKTLNYLYKHTELESAFNFNMVALSGGVPQIFSLKGILEAFIAHRTDVITRRTKYELRKAEDRAHILEGLKKALDHIDKIIKTIKKSKDTPTAHANLMKEFKFSEAQATAILEMKLQKLAGLERKHIEDELEEKKVLIKELKALLADTKKILSLVKKELLAVKNAYGDERKTKIVAHKARTIAPEDLVAEEESVLVLTRGGYIKRTDPNEYKRQKRGGIGVIDLNTKEEDMVSIFLRTSTHSDLLFFTDKGKVYQMKMHEVPEGRRATKGKSIMNFLSLSSDENVTSVRALRKQTKKEMQDLSLFMVTKKGVAKKVSANNFHDVRRSGIIAIKLASGDELLRALFVGKGDEISVATKEGQSIRFKESDIRAMGRNAAGVRAIRLSPKDEIVGADVIKSGVENASLMVMSANGYGKKTAMKEYKCQKRGGSGIKTTKVTTKTGKLIAARVVTEEESEIVAISKKGQVIRTELKDIPSLGRQTQGVRIMKLRAGDSIASLVCL